MYCVKNCNSFFAENLRFFCAALILLLVLFLFVTWLCVLGLPTMCKNLGCFSCISLFYIPACAQWRIASAHCIAVFGLLVLWGLQRGDYNCKIA